MKTLLIFISILFASSSTFAAPTEGSIIFITRKLKMTASEAPHPKEFYIDLGERQGLKVGDILEVYRVHPVLNGVSGDSSNFVRIPLGELKITLVGDFSSIARLQTSADPNGMPVLDYPAFMLGDMVQPKSNLPFDSRTP